MQHSFNRALQTSFLASTHYTNYNPWLFAINLTALIIVLIPKLPQVCPEVYLFASPHGLLEIAPQTESALSGRHIRHGNSTLEQFPQLQASNTIGTQYFGSKISIDRLRDVTYVIPLINISCNEADCQLYHSNYSSISQIQSIVGC
jgi:hypothetical protein